MMTRMMTKKARERFGGSACRQVKDTCKRSLPTSERLLPGLPDDVTLGHIATKVPWKTVFTLSSVSPAWHRLVLLGIMQFEVARSMRQGFGLTQQEHLLLLVTIIQR